MSLALGAYPTPVERFAAGETRPLWVKRDDRTAALYGGNKVRKLELLLGDARARGKTRIVTIGAVGSHQIVATSVYGQREGFSVDAVLVSQPSSAHGQDNIRAALAHGLHATVASSWAVAPAVVAARLGRDAYLVPLGGSNALGSLGFVDAAKELAAQVSAGELPEPDVVVVALGSGGTAAGLAVGFEELQMRTRIVGVAIASPVALVSAMARRVTKNTAARRGLSRARAASAVRRIEVDKRWLGRGYGYSTSEGDAATARAASAGIKLDPTYTAKAFACALDLAQGTDGVVLYWHTLSSAPLEPLLAGAGPLPPAIAQLFH
jgi:1-aminocyclopropane-1-carboxylate deaminase/D-cysteine desulfhydrase-like pyridoxal-dependent ACC family enzyme